MTEAPPFEVVSSTPQPLSGGNVAQPNGQPYQWIRFVATGARNLSQEAQVTVLAGQSAPKVSAGWAKWAEVPRWGRVAITVIEGYDPRKLEIPILFDTVTSGEAAEDVEFNIQKLEWMAGRGLPGGNKGFGPDALAESPRIQVFAVKAGTEGTPSEQVSPLIPIRAKNAGSTEEGGVHWVMTDIQFYDEPQSAGNLGPFATIRDRGGARLRQAATVTLLEHTTYKFDASAKARAEQRNKLRHKFVKPQPVTTSAMNTLRKVATHQFKKFHTPAGQQAEGRKEIVAANNPPNRKPGLGHDENKRLKNGTHIRVPLSAVKPF